MPVAEKFEQKRLLAHDWPAQAALFFEVLAENPWARCSGGQRDRPGGHSPGTRSARLCRCAGPFEPAGGAGLRARHADGGWAAAHLERPAMKPTPIKRILIVLAVLLLLVLAMATLAQAAPITVVDDRGHTVTLIAAAAAHCQPAAFADRNRLRAGCLRAPGRCGPLLQLARAEWCPCRGWAAGWTRTSRPSWRCGPTWC
jgi:hypothetical protein